MKRVGWAMMLAFCLLARSGSAQDAAAAQRLVDQVLAQQDRLWPDANVAPSLGSLFRGQLAPARAALEELIAIGEPAVGGLSRLLGHRSAHLRANAAWALGRIGGPRTAGPLLAAVTDPNPGVLYQVALARGQSGSAQALTANNKLSGSRVTAVRNAAIQTGAVLREILAAEQAETEAAKYAQLAQLLANDEAINHVARYGAPAVPAVIAALDSDDAGIVAGAAQCLAKIGDPRGLEPLWSKFSASVQAKAPETKFVQALGEFRNPAVWGYLVKCLEPDLDAVEAAQYYALLRMQTLPHAERLKVIHAFLQRMMAKGAHKEKISGAEVTISPVGAACEALATVGDASSIALLDQIINEALPPEKSIVKPLAEQAKAAIQKRAG